MEGIRGWGFRFVTPRSNPIYSLVSKMGSLAGVAKMIPGVGGQINAAQLSGATARLKKSEAMIMSMTKRERGQPDLLLKGPTSRSRWAGPARYAK